MEHVEDGHGLCVRRVRVVGSCPELCWGAARTRRGVVGAEGGAGSQRCPEFLSCSPEFPKGKEGTAFSSASVLLNKEKSLLFHRENQTNYGKLLRKMYNN